MSNKIIIEKNDFFEKYKDVEFFFVCYYKYIFTYKGETCQGDEIYIEVGGTSDEIYNHEVSIDFAENIYNLDPFHGYVIDGDCFEDK